MKKPQNWSASHISGYPARLSTSYISSRKLSFQTTIDLSVISVSLKDAAVKLESISIKGTKQEEGRVEKIEKDSRRGLFGSAIIQKNPRAGRNLRIDL